MLAKIRINIILSIVYKALTVLISFILIPMTINYINPTQYGIWLTMSSLISWFYFFDIGLGNGLKNKLAESNTLGLQINSKIFVSTTYAIMIIISFILLILFFVVNNFLNWNKILNIYSIENRDIKILAMIIVIFFCLQFVLQLINTVLTACHYTSIVSLLGFLSQLACLIGFFWLKHYTKGSLLKLVIVLAGSPLIVLTVASIILYSSKFKIYLPSIKFVKFNHSVQLLTLGGVFFVIQIGQLVLYQTDNIIISQLFGPRNVTVFNMAYKYYSVIIVLFTIAVNPYWSAFTQAYTINDYSWIKKSFTNLIKYWFLGIIITILMFFISPIFLKLWLHNSVEIPNSLLFVLGLNVIVSTGHMTCCVFLNGINKIKLQLYLYLIGMIINIPIEIFLGKIYGISGAIFSNVIVFLIMTVFLFIQCLKLIAKSANGIWIG